MLERKTGRPAEASKAGTAARDRLLTRHSIRMKSLYLGQQLGQLACQPGDLGGCGRERANLPGLNGTSIAALDSLTEHGFFIRIAVYQPSEAVRLPTADACVAAMSAMSSFPHTDGS
jgi:hypothetical protein